MHLTAVTVALMLLPSADGPSAQESLRLPDGTAIHIRLRDALSSQHLRDGDLVSFDVVEPVSIGDRLVIAKGAQATAQIVGSKAAGHFAKQGRLGWTMVDVAAVDGTRIPLRFIKEPPVGGAGAKDMSKTQKAVVGVAVSPVILFYSPIIVAAIPFLAAQKGKPETIPAGERYLAFVNGDVQVEVSKTQRDP